jgi:hypothetical protein
MLEMLGQQGLVTILPVTDVLMGLFESLSQTVFRFTFDRTLVTQLDGPTFFGLVSSFVCKVDMRRRTLKPNVFY